MAAKAKGALGVTPSLPKPLTSAAKAAGRFGTQGFVYPPDQDVYGCPRRGT